MLSFQILETLKTLSRGHIKHNGIMSKITEILCQSPIKFGLLQTEIIDKFYELGFENQNLDVFLGKVKDVSLRKNPETLFKLLMLWVSRDHFAFNEEFESMFNQMITSNKTFKIQRTSDLNLFYQFLVQQNAELAEKFKVFAKNHHYTLEPVFSHIKLSEESIQVTTISNSLTLSLSLS